MRVIHNAGEIFIELRVPSKQQPEQHELLYFMDVQIYWTVFENIHY